jgi:APA family basic amino acid/polyamine antiporter
VLTIVHSSNRRSSGGLQVFFTTLKIAVIAGFCLFAYSFVDTPQPVSFLPVSGDGALLTSSAFAVSLIYVSYAYTGWNAATYLSSELEDPQRTLPIILMSGTILVMLLFIALNFVFLYVAPMDALVGRVEVGFIAAEAAFGDLGGRFTGLIMATLLSLLARTNSSGLPAAAIFVQSSLTILFILSSSFESILVFAGFTLALNSFATVLGVFVLRYQQPDLPRPYRTFMYPVPPLIYLALTGWTLYFVLMNRPVEGLFGLGIIAAGLVFYFLSFLKSRSYQAS